ncbi:MAG: esterase, partial [Firmicutes bacterium]|nr:esterase [Bacillota bacterium]
MKLEVFTFADPGADTLLVQMADEHDLEWMESEISHIRRLCPEEDFCLKAVKVNDWNRDLSPWPADAVFGKETEFVNGCEPVT